MAHTNSTTHYSLPQFIGSDTPGWLTDVNTAMSDIDTAIYARQQDIATNSNNINSLDSRVQTAEGKITTIEGQINTPSTGILARLSTDESNISDNATNIGINTSAISGLSGSVSTISAKLPVEHTATMDANDWVGNQYTFSEASVTANSIISLGLALGVTDAEASEWFSAVILPVSVTAGSGFTVRAMSTVPTGDIDVVYTVEG